MKKTILLLAAGCVSAALISGHVLGQGTGNQANPADTPLSNTVALVAHPKSSFANTAAANTISANAIKDFKGRFNSVSNEHWYSLRTGYMVYFMEDGFGERAYYDKKGRWEYSLRYCDENKLPRDVRATVKRTYYDFAITVAQIIEIPDHMVYLIHLDDAKTHKIVRVSEDGEMEVLQEYSKSN